MLVSPLKEMYVPIITYVIYPPSPPKKTRPSPYSEAATMYKLKGQALNIQTGQGFKYRELVHPAGLSSWSIQLVNLAGLSSWFIQPVRPAGLSS